MKHFTSINDVPNLANLLTQAQAIQANPFQETSLGKNKTLGLVFMNPSLRTRLSTQKAAQNLGLSCMVLNMNAESWKLETQDGLVMNEDKAEHIKDAAAVMGQYCDLIGIRTFAQLKNREEDYQEQLLNQFMDYAGVPILSLESATLHPLQSLADILTIESHKQKNRPKVVLTWAPHPKALPQAVANSFLEWTRALDYDIAICHPEGYELAEKYAGGCPVFHSQEEAFQNADFIYAKNWSSYVSYGQILNQDLAWTVTAEKMALSPNAFFMHCLPVRRNMVVSDAVLDGENSLILEQARNRTFAAQAVLRELLKHIKS